MNMRLIDFNFIAWTGTTVNAEKVAKKMVIRDDDSIQSLSGDSDWMECYMPMLMLKQQKKYAHLKMTKVKIVSRIRKAICT